MFRFAKQGVVFWPVELPQRTEEGELVTGKAYIGYRIFSRTELRERSRKRLALMDEKLTSMQRLEQSDACDDFDNTALRERITAWRDIADENGNAIAFSHKLLTSMLADAPLHAALLHGLLEASLGAREKNLLPGPGGAPAPVQSTTAAGSGTATTDGARSPANTAGTPAAA